MLSWWDELVFMQDRFIRLILKLYLQGCFGNFPSLTGRSRWIDKIYDPSALKSFCVSKWLLKVHYSRSFLGLYEIVSVLKCRLFVLINRCWVRGRFLEYGGTSSTSTLDLPKVAVWGSAPLIRDQSSTRRAKDDNTCKYKYIKYK